MGIKKTTYADKKQILAVTDPQVAFSGAITPASANAEYQAGTPVNIDLMDEGGERVVTLARAAVEGVTEIKANGVLLHDYKADGEEDVNVAVLVFGWVNFNRLHEDVQDLMTTANVGNLKEAGVTIVVA